MLPNKWQIFSTQTYGQSRIILENDISSVCKITESNIYRDQASKRNEENWIRFFPAPRKIGVVSFTLNVQLIIFSFALLLSDKVTETKGVFLYGKNNSTNGRQNGSCPLSSRWGHQGMVEIIAK